MQPQLLTMYADKFFILLFAVIAISLLAGMLVHWLWRWVCHGFMHRGNMPSPLDYERWGHKLHQQIGIDGLIGEHVVDAWLATRSKARSSAPPEIPDDLPARSPSLGFPPRALDSTTAPQFLLKPELQSVPTEAEIMAGAMSGYVRQPETPARSMAEKERFRRDRLSAGSPPDGWQG